MKVIRFIGMWILDSESVLTGAMESVMAVLTNLLRTRARVGGSDELPKRLRNTVFRVTSRPGREKNSMNTNTRWNS